jgi:flavin reductase (DIM6/NTAB) family NADH-FMN oxidoreductase RutF
MTTGLYLVGAGSESEANLMTANLIVQASVRPRVMAASIESSAVTLGLIRRGGGFSISLLRRSDRATVRRFVKPARHDPVRRQLNGMPYLSAASGAPVLAEAVAYIDCRLIQTVELGSHTLCLGGVLAAGFLAMEDTPTLRMQDTRMSYGG